MTFVIVAEVKNQSQVVIYADSNDRHRPVRIEPGETGGVSPGVNNNLKRVQVWSRDDQSDAVSHEFNLKNGKKRVRIVVTGPPLAMDV